MGLSVSKKFLFYLFANLRVPTSRPLRLMDFIFSTNSLNPLNAKGAKEIARKGNAKNEIKSKMCFVKY
jgi:hypothetical protein